MNKNILFFAVFSFFSFAFASEEITEQCPATTEDACAQETTFTPMKFTLSYSIKPGADASTADFDAATSTMRELIDAGHRGSPALYQNLLTFIKELQEAIIAGVNLFTVASTSQENITVIVEKAVIEDIEESIENAVENLSQQSTSKGLVEDVTNNLTVAYSIVVDKVENLQVWESVKAQMIALAQALNMRTKSPAELSDMLEIIMHDAQPLHNSTTTLTAEIQTQE